MIVNYGKVDNVIRNIIFTINALKTANNQLESEISRLSNCKGTTENPHDHSSEIASIRKTIDNNEEKIKKLDSICNGLSNFKSDVFKKDIDLSRLFENNDLLEKIMQKVISPYKCPYEDEQMLTDEETTNGEGFVEGMGRKNKYLELELPSGDDVGAALTRTSIDCPIVGTMWDNTSTQYKISTYYGDTIYEDENGYARVTGVDLESDPYLVSLAPYYREAAIKANIGNNQGYGAIYKIEYEDGNSIYVTSGDAKGEKSDNEGFDDEKMFHKKYKNGSECPESFNLLEFMPAVSYNNIPNYDQMMGSATSVTNDSRITKIYLIIDCEIVW